MPQYSTHYVIVLHHASSQVPINSHQVGQLGIYSLIHVNQKIIITLPINYNNSLHNIDTNTYSIIINKISDIQKFTMHIMYCCMTCKKTCIHEDINAGLHSRYSQKQISVLKIGHKCAKALARKCLIIQCMLKAKYSSPHLPI